MKPLLFLAFAATAIARSIAAEPIPADVAAFSRNYFSTMQEKGLAGVLPFLHPEALLDYKAQVLAVYRIDKGGRMTRAVFGEKATLAELEAMPAEKFLAKALAHTSDRMGQDVGKMLQSVEVIGVVPEGELVHAVSRSVAIVFGQKITTVSVTTLKRHRGEWRAMMESKTEGEMKLDGGPLDGAPPPPPPPPIR